MKNIDFIVVTGLSGAGKTTAMLALEEMNYYTIDNCPYELVANFIELIKANKEKYKKVALSINQDASKVIEYLSTITFINLSTVFLESSKLELLARYRLTRRIHPFQKNNLSVEQAIEKEVKLYKEVRANSKYIIDTSKYKASFLIEMIYQLFNKNIDEYRLRLRLVSFGFKHGIPIDSDLVLDARSLINPYYVDNLKNKTGNDLEVYEYVMQSEETQKYIKVTQKYLDYVLALFRKEGRSLVSVAIGCSGGQHRSVSLVNYFYENYKLFYPTYKTHRDIN